MLEIRHKAIECIGCAQCVEIAPNYWQLDDEGMAKLLDKTKDYGQFEFAMGFHDDEQSLKAAEDACPVDIIKISTS